MTSDLSKGGITADDVAERAGVSRWTVNRAFKKDASISEKSRKKVMQAADDLGYTPDLLAASLASDQSNMVSLLIDDFSNPHKLVMMERLTRVLRQNGWDTLLVNTLGEDDVSAALLNASQRRVDAAVLIGSNFDDTNLASALGSRRVRKLIVFARFSENPNTISICCEDQRAMEAIGDHVRSRGYTRPAFLAGPQTLSAHVTRKETFLSRWKAATGFTPDCASVPVYDPQLAYQCTCDLLRRHGPDSRPDIIVCENDALAMGAMDAIRYEFGLRVPQDIAVTGFDDVPQAASPQFRLTTYRQPITAMAQGLVEVLQGTADLEKLPQFSGELILRDSA